MARPRKPIALKKRHQVNIRLNDGEYEFSKLQSEICGLSINDWIIKSALSKRTLPPAINPDIKQLYVQFVRVGTNINQLARNINTGSTNTDIIGELVKEVRFEMNALKEIIANDLKNE